MSIRRRKFFPSCLQAALYLCAAVWLGAPDLIFAGPIPSHVYELNGSLADSVGSIPLTSHGGSINSFNYTFEANQGLSLSGALVNGGTYSIVVDFYFTQLTGYRKIIDFKDRDVNVDTGLYSHQVTETVMGMPVTTTFLEFNGSPPLPADRHDVFRSGELVRLAITRSAVSNQVSMYINGSSQYSFFDSGSPGKATFDKSGNVIQFFRDDTDTNSEASAGLVDRIAIYDTVLTPSEVSTLGGPTAVPEPGSLTAIALGLLAGGGWYLHRRQGRHDADCPGGRRESSPAETAEIPSRSVTKTGNRPLV